MTTTPSAAVPVPAQSPPSPTIHQAELASGPSGAVLRGVVIDFLTAVLRRQAATDVVVCGDDLAANRQLAGEIEAAVGPRTPPQAPERKAGPMALPHYHQQSREPDGHTFYETQRRKARKKP